MSFTQHDYDEYIEYEIERQRKVDEKRLEERRQIEVEYEKLNKRGSEQ